MQTFPVPANVTPNWSFHTQPYTRSFHPPPYPANFNVLINQGRKIPAPKPSVYIKTLTPIIYRFTTPAALLQTFHLKDSESCPTFKFLGSRGGFFCVCTSAKTLSRQEKNRKKKKQRLICGLITSVLFPLPFCEELRYPC